MYVYEKSPSILMKRGRYVAETTEKPTEEMLRAKQLVKREDNVKRVSLAFRRLVLSNFVGGEPPIFVTFTFKTDETIQEGYRKLNLFTKRLRYKHGEELRYIAVPEFGKNGTQRLHFHALIWGMPLDLMKEERKLRVLASIWEYGHVDVVVTDGHVKVGNYLAKYLSKAHVRPEMFNQKSYVASRNVFRPIVYTDFVSLTLDYVLEVAEPIKTKSYDTKWLGRCEYKVYQLTEPMVQDLKK